MYLLKMVLLELGSRGVGVFLVLGMSKEVYGMVGMK